jgi:hypothetical protein
MRLHECRPLSRVFAGRSWLNAVGF